MILPPALSLDMANHRGHPLRSFSIPAPPTVQQNGFAGHMPGMPGEQERGVCVVLRENENLIYFVLRIFALWSLEAFTELGKALQSHMGGENLLEFLFFVLIRNCIRRACKFNFCEVYFSHISPPFWGLVSYVSVMQSYYRARLESF